MARRDRLPRALPLLCTLLALGATFAGGGSAQPLSADADGEKISKGLETQLAGAAGSKEVAVIVTLKADATAERVDALEGAVGELGAVERFSIIDGLAATVTKNQVEELSTLAIVESVQENSIVRALNDSAQSSFGVTQARTDVPAAEGNADGLATYSKDDLVAAVIDTGIDPGHLDLDDGKVLAFADCMTNPCTTPAPFDDHGHGTHVAATIAGDGEGRDDLKYKGVAPGAGLVGVKVLDSAGSGTDAGVIRGVEWAVANRVLYGIEALNLSLGDDGCSNGLDPLSVAVNNAVAAGLVVAVSAGNDGPDACTIASPAAAADAITVGAMADLGQNGFYQASFSSRGPTLDGRTKPDISAPGVGITSAQRGTTSGYVTFNGTSMSSPFVAGVALLMLDVNPALSPAQVKGHLLTSAVDWGTAGTDNDYGAGRLDAYAAVALAGAAIATPPTVPTHLLRQGSLAGAGAYADYPLTVTSAGTPIAATLVIANHSSSRDFDLRLMDASNNTVASSLTTLRQDQLGYLPSAPGTYTLRVESYAGSGSYVLDLSAGIDPLRPLNTSVPTVAGTLAQGQTLSAGTGTWANTPLSYAYQWSRCNGRDGDACVDIAGATTSTYALEAADVAKRVRVTVTAANLTGTASAGSAPALVPPPPPANTSAPTIAGTTQQGQTLTAATGSWTNSPDAYAYQWSRCNGGCSTIGGATGQSYVLAAADVGATLQVAVTASNSGGSATATSAATGLVIAAPTPTPAPAPTAPAPSGGGGGGGGGTDLELTGGADRATAALGGSFLYLFYVKVKNYAVTSGASEVVLTAQLPAGVELLTTKVNRGQGCTGTTTVTCRLDFLSGPLIAVAELTVRVTASGPLAGSASVKGLEPDPDATNDTVSTLVNAAVAAPGETSVRPTAPPVAAVAPKRTGTNDANTLTGTSGPDFIRGLGGDDRLFGGRGNDRLDGGSGKDVLSGGPGNDTILARDKTRDAISCGTGRDSVTADRVDVVARDCETVRRR